MAKDVKVSTRERIMQASIQLFNEQGIHSVPTYKIASHLAISPGNLTYHFANKTEILRALVDKLERDLVEALQDFINPGDPQEMAQYLYHIFRVLWRYRFFFESVNFIINTDEEMRDRYRQLEGDIHDKTVELLSYLVEQDYMRPVLAPNSIDLLADNIWAIWLHFVRSPLIGDADLAAVEEEAIYNCAKHHVSVLEPYFTAKPAARLYDALQRLHERG